MVGRERSPRSARRGRGRGVDGEAIRESLRPIMEQRGMEQRMGSSWWLLHHGDATSFIAIFGVGGESEEITVIHLRNRRDASVGEKAYVVRRKLVSIHVRNNDIIFAKMCTIR